MYAIVKRLIDILPSYNTRMFSIVKLYRKSLYDHQFERKLRNCSCNFSPLDMISGYSVMNVLPNIFYNLAVFINYIIKSEVIFVGYRLLHIYDVRTSKKHFLKSASSDSGVKKPSKNVKRSNVSKFLWLKKKKGNILSFSVQNSTQLRHIKRNDKRFPEMISI